MCTNPPGDSEAHSDLGATDLEFRGCRLKKDSKTHRQLRVRVCLRSSFMNNLASYSSNVGWCVCPKRKFPLDSVGYMTNPRGRPGLGRRRSNVPERTPRTEVHGIGESNEIANSRLRPGKERMSLNASEPSGSGAFPRGDLQPLNI